MTKGLCRSCWESNVELTIQDDFGVCNECKEKM